MIASHIIPVLNAVREFGVERDEGFVADKFIEGVVSGLSADDKADLLDFLTKAKKLSDIRSIAGENEFGGEPVKQILDNLNGYQDFFDLVLEKIMKVLKKEN